MIALEEWEEWEDENGKWKKHNNVLLHTPSQKYLDEHPTTDPEPQPPSEIEILKQENEMLQMSVMEMTMYAASQDERLKIQENALLEISMLLTGGM